MRHSVSDKEIFHIADEAAKTVHYGSNQEWYRKRWQRMSGCGPCAVSNIIYYLCRTGRCGPACCSRSKTEFITLMEEIWRYVTPSLGGISSTSMFCKGAQSYLKDMNIKMELDALDIPKKKDFRPDFGQVIAFLAKALDRDTPVAFLNLEHGTVHILESWHWVTIISLDYAQEENSAFVEILDGGLFKRIDLFQWYTTTRLGGGFVSFNL